MNQRWRKPRLGSFSVTKAEQWLMDLFREVRENPEVFNELNIDPVKVGEVTSFADMEFLTRNKGFVVDLGDSRFEVTIVKSR